MMRDAPDKFERLPKLMSENEVRDDSSVQTAVRNLFIGSAPERESELAEMWKELDLIFQLTPDIHEGDRIIMDAGAYRYVRFNHRVLRAFWIAGYTAWEGSRTVAEAPSLQALDLTRFRELILSYESCLASTEADLEALPVGVAEPGQYPDANTDPQGRAASELATIAVAWASCTNYGISGTSGKERVPILTATMRWRSMTRSYRAMLSRRLFSWSRSISMPNRQINPPTWYDRSVSLESISDCSL
jgi:hypothetical protein